MRGDKLVSKFSGTALALEGAVNVLQVVTRARSCLASRAQNAQRAKHAGSASTLSHVVAHVKIHPGTLKPGREYTNEQNRVPVPGMGPLSRKALQHLLAQGNPSCRHIRLETSAHQGACVTRSGVMLPSSSPWGTLASVQQQVAMLHCQAWAAVSIDHVSAHSSGVAPGVHMPQGKDSFEAFH